MNQVALVASVPLDLEGTHYEPGDSLTVSSAKYGYLLVTGKARLSSAPRAPGKPVRRSHVVRGPRGQYRRRDMQPEE